MMLSHILLMVAHRKSLARQDVLIVHTYLTKIQK